jgi:hypothetical protein
LAAYRESAAAYRESVAAYRESAAAYRESAAAYRESVVAYRESVAAYRESAAAYRESVAAYGRGTAASDCPNKAHKNSEPRCARQRGSLGFRVVGRSAAAAVVHARGARAVGHHEVYVGHAEVVFDRSRTSGRLVHAELHLKCLG